MPSSVLERCMAKTRELFSKIDRSSRSLFHTTAAANETHEPTTQAANEKPPIILKSYLEDIARDTKQIPALIEEMKRANTRIEQLSTQISAMIKSSANMIEPAVTPIKTTEQASIKSQTVILETALVRPKSIDEHLIESWRQLSDVRIFKAESFRSSLAEVKFKCHVENADEGDTFIPVSVDRVIFYLPNFNYSVQRLESRYDSDSQADRSKTPSDIITLAFKKGDVLTRGVIR